VINIDRRTLKQRISDQKLLGEDCGALFVEIVESKHKRENSKREEHLFMHKMNGRPDRV